MSLWVDKYRPRRLDQLLYHEGVTHSLRALAGTGDFPHLLVYGPSGAGKKTRIYATLHELFGPLVEKLKIDVKTFTTLLSRRLEFNVLSSPNHLEITPSDMGNNDRVVIQDLLKDVASTEQVDFLGSTKAAAKHCFKVVVINEADSLSRDAQAALRRTMEKYSANIRLILTCTTTSNIIAPIKSRTLLVRVPAPTSGEIASLLQHVSVKELVKFNGDETAKRRFLEQVADHSERNVRRALLSFETIAMQAETVTVTGAPSIKLDWETIISNMAGSVVAQRTVANLAKIRAVLYELLSHCIPARTILKTLLFDLVKRTPASTIPLVELGALFDERLSLGQKSIFHLEGFVAKAMVALGP